MIWSCLAFILIALLTFANALSYPFVHDETVFLLQNPNIARLNDLWGVFVSPGAVPIDGMNAYYRPMLELLYRVEYALYGFNTFGWHLFNVLLHGVNAALLMRLLVLIDFNRTVSIATALFFVVHPIQTESVACVAGISNLLMAFFVFLSLIAYLKGRRVISVIFFILGMMTKEQTIMVLPLIMLIDSFRRRDGKIWWGVFAIVTLLFLSWRQALTGSHLLSDIIASPGELTLRILSMAQVALTDLRLLFLPDDLHYYRSTDILKTHWFWWVGVLLVIFLLLKLRRLELWFGFGFFLLALLPVLNIVPMVNEYSLIQSMEHFLYVPMIGIMLALVCVISRYCRKYTEQIFLILIFCFFFIALKQNEYWKNEIVLFERTVAFEPDFARAHYYLARAYYFDQQLISANEHYRIAYAIMEGYSRKAVGPGVKLFYDRNKIDILFDWAHNDEGMGCWALAERKYREAIILDAHDPKLWDNLGVLYVRMGRLKEAVPLFEKALSADPGFNLAREHLLHIK